jgi:hypothetical protein
MPDNTLQDLKTRQRALTREYMGRFGIHGIGLRRKKDCIYVLSSQGLNKDVVQRMEVLIKPHRLLVLDAPQAQLL